MPSGLILSEGKTSTYTSSRERVGNVIGGDRMNPGIRILPLPSANGLFGGWMSG